MACYYPWSPNGASGGTRPFSCGKCHGCQLEHARQWAVRCANEASLHDCNSFVTLTFREDMFRLDHKYFQDFMKRLRFRVRPLKVSYFMSGEYGEDNSRAHFHALLFNVGFPDRVYFKMSRSGNKLYRSPLLESLWTAGYSSIGDVNFDSAGYVARYAMKKVAWKGDELHEILDVDTGEVFSRPPEYCRMSLRPAIGKEWIRRFRSDVYPSGKVLINGVEARAPRYYDKKLREWDAGAYMRLCNERASLSPAALREQMPDRLAAREAVSVARCNLSKTKL